MKFETKISGTKVTEYGKVEFFFPEQIVNLKDCIKKIRKQKTMNYILDKFRFTKGCEEGDDWYCIVDYDSLLKMSIMEKEEYSEIREKLEEYFGERWIEEYIRFNH